ncbi:uncharacterized protein LOC113647731 isoform X1 [Tachysurus ichikawai]
MRQIVKVAKHCCDRRVFHHDINTRNILIDPDTLKVKLIYFSSGDLMKDEVYSSFSGSGDYFPPGQWNVFCGSFYCLDSGCGPV